MSYEDAMHGHRVSSTSAQVEDCPLFVVPVREMARREDPDTSKSAAMFVAGRMGRYMQDVLDAYLQFGDMTARTCESLSALSHLGYSTCRKRTGDLFRKGLLVDTGRREGVPPATVWSASTQSRAA